MKDGKKQHTKRAHKEFALALEDRWQDFRLKMSQRRGDKVAVVPYRGYGRSGENGWVRVFARVVMAKPGSRLEDLHLPAVVEEGVRGWRHFISPTVAEYRVTIRINGATYDVYSDRGGVIDERLAVNLEPGWHHVEFIVDDSEPVSGHVFMVNEKQKHGIICDVDDTVVVTMLPRPLLAAWNSFVIDEHARVPTPGMAVFLDRFATAHPGAPTLYLSTGAWNTNRALSRFMARNLFPDGPLLLTDWGPVEGRWFRSGIQHKVDNLRRLAREFPDISWLLVGDDGQKDPNIYAEFARRYPDNVSAIVIRQLTPSEAALAGGRNAAIMNTTPGVPWVYEPDGGRIAARLAALGLMPEAPDALHPDH